MTKNTLRTVALETVANYRQVAEHAVGAYRASGHRLLAVMSRNLERGTRRIAPTLAEALQQTTSKVGAVAGCLVAQGAIERGCRIRVHRDNRTIGDYALESLKRHRDDVKEVPRGMECGIKLANFNDLKPDDILEAYRIEEVARKLD